MLTYLIYERKTRVLDGNYVKYAQYYIIYIMLLDSKFLKLISLYFFIFHIDNVVEWGWGWEGGEAPQPPGYNNALV